MFRAPALGKFGELAGQCVIDRYQPVAHVIVDIAGNFQRVAAMRRPVPPGAGHRGQKRTRPTRAIISSIRVVTSSKFLTTDFLDTVFLRILGRSGA